MGVTKRCTGVTGATGLLQGCRILFSSSVSSAAQQRMYEPYGISSAPRSATEVL
jgi:hypothetical protein